MYGMCSQDARDKREHLIQVYHKQFSDVLQRIGFMKKIPSVLDLQVELLRNGLVGKLTRE